MTLFVLVISISDRKMTEKETATQYIYVSAGSESVKDTV